MYLFQYSYYLENRQVISGEEINYYYLFSGIIDFFSLCPNSFSLWESDESWMSSYTCWSLCCRHRIPKFRLISGNLSRIIFWRVFLCFSLSTLIMYTLDYLFLDSISTFFHSNLLYSFSLFTCIIVLIFSIFRVLTMLSAISTFFCVSFYLFFTYEFLCFPFILSELISHSNVV